MATVAGKVSDVLKPNNIKFNQLLVPKSMTTNYCNIMCFKICCAVLVPYTLVKETNSFHCIVTVTCISVPFWCLQLHRIIYFSKTLVFTVTDTCISAQFWYLHFSTILVFTVVVHVFQNKTAISEVPFQLSTNLRDIFMLHDQFVNYC